MVGVWVVHYLLISPRQNLSQELQKNIVRMTDTYIELGAMDLSKIVARLERKVDFLDDKRIKLDASILTNEQIPFFVSRLKQKAKTAGLKLETSIQDEVAGQDEFSADTLATPLVSIDVNFSGTFPSILNLFQQIESADEVLLIRDFNLFSTEENEKLLTGQLKLILDVTPASLKLQADGLAVDTDILH